MRFDHKPVLLEEVLEILKPRPGQVFVDGTVGGGGHSRQIIERILPGGRLIAIDQDEDALQAAKANLAGYSAHITFVKNNFKNLEEILTSLQLPYVDGILLDIGVSSYQLDEERRGFSYQGEAPLDMRMDRGLPTSAADLVNKLEAVELTRIIRDFGEEIWARRIAEFIVDKRKARGPLQTADELVQVIKEAIPARARRQGPHPARRTFQALRIAVNDELGALEIVVNSARRCLKSGGRFAVITFHSLEDRIVKKAFQNAAGRCQCPPGLPRCACGRRPKVKILTTKPIRPGENEVAQNPRARGARLRVIENVLKEGEVE